MLRRTLCLAAAAALLATAGCGGKADGLVKDLIADQYAYADAMDAGDEVKMKECEERMKATTKKFDDLKLSEDEKKKLKEKYKEELEKANMRMYQATVKKMAPGAFPPGTYIPISPDTPISGDTRISPGR
jgi:hypothetical protein